MSMGAPETLARRASLAVVKRRDRAASVQPRRTGPPSPPSPQGQLDVETERQIRGMSLPDLRVALRARGLSPAGGLEALRERLVDCIKSGGSAQVSSGEPRAAMQRRAALSPSRHERDPRFATAGGG